MIDNIPDRMPRRIQRLRPHLDPCCDYIIFETRAAQRGKHVWASIQAALEQFQGAILEQQIRWDRLSGYSTLVIKLDPQQSEPVKSAVLALVMNSDMIVSLYYRQTRSAILSKQQPSNPQRRRHNRRKKKKRLLDKPTQLPGGIG